MCALFNVRWNNIRNGKRKFSRVFPYFIPQTSSKNLDAEM